MKQRKTKLRTQKAGEKLRLVVVFDGNKDSVEENEDDDEPIERLTLHQATNFYSAPNTHQLLAIFCLVSRIQSISTLSTSKTVMTTIRWLQTVRLLLQFTVTLLLRSLDDVSFLYDLISFWWLVWGGICLSLSFSTSVSVSLSSVCFFLCLHLLRIKHYNSI